MKDVPKGRSYKMGARGGIYYIGTLAEKQQDEGNKRTPRGAVEAQPKNGNGGGAGASRAPASAATGQNNVASPERQEKERSLEDMLFNEGKNDDFIESQEKKISDEARKYGEKNHADPAYSKFLGKYFTAINRELRGNSMSESELNEKYDLNKENWNQSFKEITKDMDSLFESAPEMPEGLQLWRGINPKNEDTRNLLKNLKIGDLYQDKGYQSHSLNPSVAMAFSTVNSSQKEKPWVIRAITNKSTKAISVASIHSEYEVEREVTVHRDTKWKVASQNSFEKFNMITVVPA